MKRILLLLPLLFGVLTASAQQRSGSSLKGVVLDAANNTPLIGALVLVDSTRHSTAGQRGDFTVTGIARGEREVKISFLGYETVTRKVNVNQPTVNLGTIRLKEEGHQMDAVTVSGLGNMAIQKGDTTQYNASAFKTNPDADAGDLVNKLPGAEVTDGTVKVQGEEVKRAYVDGKLFFGDDVMAAMKNLPVDAIESIQVFDEMSDEAKFAGFDDGERQRALNIVTRHKVNRSTTGRIEAGYGRELDKDSDGNYQNRYLVAGNLNTFTDKNRWSLNGTFNNVNRANRSEGYSGGGGSGIRGGGLRTINSVGLNYSGTWNPQLKFNASYSFNENRNETESWNEKDYYKQEEETESRFERVDRNGRSEANTHQGNIRLEYEGKKDRVFFYTNASFRDNDSWNNTLTQTFRDGINTNNVDNRTLTDGDSYNIRGNLMWTHRLGAKAGRTLTLGVNTRLTDNDSTKDEIREAESSDDKYTMTTTNSWERSVGGRLSYAEPLSEKSRLMATYRIEYNKSRNEVEAWDNIKNEKDEALSSTYSRNYLRNTAGLGYAFNSKLLRVSTGMDYQIAEMERNEYFPKEDALERNFYSWQPYATVRYSLQKTKYFDFRYTGRSSLPAVEQLQNVIVEDGMSLTAGNPDLKQSYTHYFNLRYSTANVEKSTNFWTFVSARLTQKSVSYRTRYFDTDEVLPEYNDYLAIEGMTLRTPVNLNGAVTLQSRAGYSFTFRPLRTNINLSGGYTYGRSPSYTEQKGEKESLLNYANTHKGEFRVGFVSNVSENVDFDISSNTSLSYVSNTQLENRRTWNQDVRARVNVIFLGGITYTTDFSWRYQHVVNRSNSTTNSYVWNMGFGYKFLARKNAEFRITMYDVLDQSQKAPAASFLDTYQQTSWTRSMGRYLMATLSYRFNSMNRLGSRAKTDTETERRMAPGGPGMGSGMGRGQGPGGGPGMGPGGGGFH